MLLVTRGKPKWQVIINHYPPRDPWQQAASRALHPGSPRIAHVALSTGRSKSPDLHPALPLTIALASTTRIYGSEEPGSTQISLCVFSWRAALRRALKELQQFTGVVKRQAAATFVARICKDVGLLF